MDNHQEIIFTADCIINLDDLPPLEDYEDLLATISQQIKSKTITHQTLKRLLSADIEDLIRPQQSYNVIKSILTNLHNYPDFLDSILALFFQLVQMFMFDPDVPENIVRSFLQALKKNMNPVCHKMLIMFLKRMSSKIVYITQQKFQVLISYFKLGLSIKCPIGDQDKMVYIIDMLLRSRKMRILLLKLANQIEPKTEQQRVFVIKSKVYIGQVDLIAVSGIKNEHYQLALKQLLSYQ